MGASIAARPRVAHGQQRPMPVIGFLHGASPEAYAPMMTAFREGLKEAGYVEATMWRSNTAGRKDITIDCRRWQPISFADKWP
jgi:hypothetical protein